MRDPSGAIFIADDVVVIGIILIAGVIFFVLADGTARRLARVCADNLPRTRPGPRPAPGGGDVFPPIPPDRDDGDCDCWCVGYQAGVRGTPTHLGPMSAEECDAASEIFELPDQPPYEERCACGEGWWELDE